MRASCVVWRFFEDDIYILYSLLVPFLIPDSLPSFNELPRVFKVQKCIKNVFTVCSELLHSVLCMHPLVAIASDLDLPYSLGIDVRRPVSVELKLRLYHAPSSGARTHAVLL